MVPEQHSSRNKKELSPIEGNIFSIGCVSDVRVTFSSGFGLSTSMPFCVEIVHDPPFAGELQLCRALDLRVMSFSVIMPDLFREKIGVEQ